MRTRPPHRSFVHPPRRLLRSLIAPSAEAPGAKHPVAGYDALYGDFCKLLQRLARSQRLAAPVPRPAAEGDENALDAAEGRFLAALTRAWAANAQVDEIYAIPEVHVVTAGHRAHPSAARQELLVELGQLPPQTWMSLRSFCAHLGGVHPLIYRPLRDERNWLVRGRLPGLGTVAGGDFEAVEGTWATFLIGTSLSFLGIVALGFDEQGELAAFRLTAFGKELLSGRDEPRWTVEQENWVIVQPNFEVLVPAGADGAILDGVEGMATPLGGDSYRLFKLEPASLLKAMLRGWTLAEVQSFLERYGRAEMPQNVQFELAQWAGSFGDLRVRPRVVIQCQNPVLLDEMGRLAGVREGFVRLGDQAAAVEPASLRRVMDAVLARGVLPLPEGPLVRLAIGLTTNGTQPPEPAAEAGAESLARELEGAAKRLRGGAAAEEVAEALLRLFATGDRPLKW